MIKATFDGDTKEPKPKHVQFLIQALKGQYKEMTPEVAYSTLFEDYIKNIISWVHTLKYFMIINFSLEDCKSVSFIASETINRKQRFIPFKKDSDSSKYKEEMHYSLCQEYLNYILQISDFFSKCNIYFLQQEKISTVFLCNADLGDIFWIYDQILNILSQALKIIPYIVFLKKYRIYVHLFILIMKEFTKFYKIIVILIASLVGKLNKMNSLEASKFVELYEGLPAFSLKAKQLITNAITNLNIQLELPLFFENDENNRNTIKEYLKLKMNVDAKPKGNNLNLNLNANANLNLDLNFQNEEKHKPSKLEESKLPSTIKKINEQISLLEQASDEIVSESILKMEFSDSNNLIDSKENKIDLSLIPFQEDSSKVLENSPTINCSKADKHQKENEDNANNKKNEKEFDPNKYKKGTMSMINTFLQCQKQNTRNVAEEKKEILS